MKKLLLLSVMALAGLSASAQFKSQPSVNPQTNSKMMMANKPQSQRSFQAVAPRQDLGMRFYAPLKGKRTLDPAKVKPVTRAQRASVSALPATQNKSFNKGNTQSRRMVNLQPTMTLNTKTSSRVKAARKAPAFAESYTGIGVDYSTGESAQWTMTPTTATYDNEGEEEEADVLVDVIPTPDYLSELFPSGIPVKYTVGDDDVITILPQAIAHYENEAQDTTFYLTLFSANSEDFNIYMEVGENGKISIIDGNWICLGEFANVVFDEELSDGDAYLGYDELYANVSYYYHIETSIVQEYNGHGVDYFANQAVDWVMQRGKTVWDDEETNFFVNMTPMLEIFSVIYPDGIDVEYEQEGNTITVKPQVIANIPADEESEAEYIILCSGTSDDGSIVLTEGENGTLTVNDDEAIIIGAWSTNAFDPSFETYLGSYSYIENIKYRLPNEPAEKPADVACEPNELVLFAGLFYSGVSYTDNLAIMGAYAPTSFRNCTMDIATGFDWSVKETYDDVETTITGKNRDFSLYTKGDAVYEDFSLTAYNEDKVSEPYAWGTGHCLDSDDEVRFEAIHAYAGGGASSLRYEDGETVLYPVMTRQNPDYDLTFYINWSTPDIYAQYSSSPVSISTIYSYQGKPATPLYLTGVTLPLVDFSANDDFNLHIKLCKCSRSVTGSLTLGDIIAEGDATMENVIADYSETSGLTAVEFTELYVEDEFGMSESVDYLFIEDEFVIVIEGWDNGTFSAVLGSQEYNFNEITSTWFQTADSERLRSYGGGWPQLFIGLLDATYGYLHTEDDTDLLFNKDGGTSSIHIEPMYYAIDEETEEPTYNLDVESVIEDGEEVDEFPEWLSVEVANEDYSTAIGIDEEGEEYEYFVNGIDYDLVFTAEALPEGVENRTCKIVFFQTGAKLTVTVTQDIDPDGISTVVERTPIKNSCTFNIAGQAVGNNAKGIIVKDGRKVIVK